MVLSWLGKGKRLQKRKGTNEIVIRIERLKKEVANCTGNTSKRSLVDVGPFLGLLSSSLVENV